MKVHKETTDPNTIRVKYLTLILSNHYSFDRIVYYIIITGTRKPIRLDKSLLPLRFMSIRNSRRLKSWSCVKSAAGSNVSSGINYAE